MPGTVSKATIAKRNATRLKNKRAKARAAARSSPARARTATKTKKPARRKAS